MKQPIVYSGAKFERLTVLHRGDPKIMPSGKKQQRWECVCDCGTRKLIAHSSLHSGLTRSCGCMHVEASLKNLEKTRGKPSPNMLDLTGRRFSMLTVLGFDGKKNGSTYWSCKCDCGNAKSVKGALLKFGHIKSCGCLISITSRVNGKSNIGRILQTKRDATKAKYLGQRFGMIVVTDTVYGDKFGRAVVACDCGKTAEVAFGDLTAGKQKSCGCQAGISGAELELFDWVKSIASDAEHDISIDGSRLRWDVVVPSAKIAIEFNGTIWHSSRYRSDKDYHASKRSRAESAGYRQISVWQDDWIANKGRIQQVILDAINPSNERVGARKCKTVTVDSSTAQAWHNAHHVQKGSVLCNMHLGLEADGNLVAVASFKKDVLVRYTVKSGVSIAGGLRKLIADSRLDTVITYCDRDYFGGGVYEKSGFAKTGTSLQLTYVKNGVRHRRERFMKNKLAGLGIEVLDSDTEKSALERAGIYQCWNSGVDRWEYRRESL